MHLGLVRPALGHQLRREQVRPVARLALDVEQRVVHLKGTDPRPASLLRREEAELVAHPARQRHRLQGRSAGGRRRGWPLRLRLHALRQHVRRLRGWLRLREP
eukprot:scaffold106932_cov64-Phaeocystis_antarctica.AAC.8